MNVGVMKDYKLELRNLHDSDALLFSRQNKKRRGLRVSGVDFGESIGHEDFYTTRFVI
jgi:hypothetical protein